MTEEGQIIPDPFAGKVNGAAAKASRLSKIQKPKKRTEGEPRRRGRYLSLTFFLLLRRVTQRGGSKSGPSTIPYSLALHRQANLALAFCHTVTGLVLRALAESGRWRTSDDADIGSKGSGLRARARNEFKIGIRLSHGRLSISDPSCSVPENLPSLTVVQDASKNT